MISTVELVSEIRSTLFKMENKFYKKLHTSVNENPALKILKSIVSSPSEIF